MNPKAMKKFLLNSDEVLQSMKDLAHKSVNDKMSEEKAFKLQKHRANEIID